MLFETLPILKLVGVDPERYERTEGTYNICMIIKSKLDNDVYYSGLVVYRSVFSLYTTLHLNVDGICIDPAPSLL